jgi:ectoine hydroxylase-related dioxygenase (phytanoyl-CoA dioxygenase family)
LRSWEREGSGDPVIARDRVIEEKQCGSMSHSVSEFGYAIVPNVLSSEEIRGLLSALETSAGHRGRAGVRHLMGNQAVRKLAFDPRMLHIAQAVSGNEAFPFKATLFDKSPDANWLITWHQDTAFPLRDKIELPGWGPWSTKEGVIHAHAPASALEKVIALRLHLDDSTDQNGPLRVVPGTHRKGVLTDAEVEAITGNTAPTNCLMPKGGIIVMRPLLIHASSKSQSAIPRRVLHIEYATQDAVPSPLHLAIA